MRSAGVRRIEHDADDAQEAVVFDDQDGPSAGTREAPERQGASGSRSSSSACSTRAFML